MTTKPMNPRSRTFREASRFEIASADARLVGSLPPSGNLHRCPACGRDGAFNSRTGRCSNLSCTRHKANAEHPCPKCAGKGKLSVEVHEGGTARAEPTADGGLRVAIMGGGVSRTVTLACVYCEGRGTVSAAALDQIKREDGMWCRCEHSSGSTHHRDGQGPEINKHHWRCDDCGGVTQIG